jgi:Patatin-like phospholipase
MSACLPLWKVLLEEYTQLHGKPNPEPTNLNEVIKLLHTQKRAALCISGGGIRSASFALGVIQGLARLGTEAKNSFLSQIHYLSTVSGGGYIGSWLSAWSKRRGGIENVVKELRPRPAEDKLHPEPRPVEHLRQYSNYLTPQLGLLSADTWAFVGAYLRNLLLMWVVLVPFFVGILALPRFFVSLTLLDKQFRGEWMEWTAIGLFAFALAFVGWTRPTAKPTRKTWLYSDYAFKLLCLIPLVLFAAALVIGHAWYDLTKYGLGKMAGYAAAFTVLSSLIYSIRKIKDAYAVGKTADIWKKQIIELVVAVISGLLLGALIYLFLSSFPSPLERMPRADIMAWLNGQVPLLSGSVASAYVVFGVPLVLLALLLQATIFIGGTGRRNDDFDREWWGRAAAWVIIAAIGWIVITAVVIYGPVGIFYAPRTIAAIGGVTGLFALGAGASSKTSANEKQKDKESTTGKVSNLLLALATPVFALVLLAALSLGTTAVFRNVLLIHSRADHGDDLSVLKRTSWTYEKKAEKTVLPLGKGDQKLATIAQPGIETDKLAGLDHLYVVEQTPWSLAYLLAVAGVLFAFLASWPIGVNRFSVHALYRDRIIRAYLGASNTKRNPNPFTGFDPNDNIQITDLLTKPLHVVNMCLNLASGDDLAWQERKGASFTASPLHCGSLALRGANETEGSYRSSADYGGPQGMKLGTAVGISGAAASPNQGYHSSQALALIMTFFNVRLGWWLGNPNNDGTYKLDNPYASLKPLLAEAFGKSDDKHPYVYLSDGGHFENLGFYEMVLRRCRYIVISDAGMDDSFIFDDLGMAIRKIYIDFGITVVVDNVRLYPRSPDREKKFDNPKYCATGRILYSRVDGTKEEEDGEFVYIKPVFYGDEPRDIFNYAMANEKFPHEPTLSDQFFSESQLESYRKLGEYAIEQIVHDKGAANINLPEELIAAANAYAKK